MNITVIRALFYLSAAYDGALGLAFIFAPAAIYTLFNVPPPNHLGYVQFPAAMLMIFAVMFLSVARNPAANKSLIPYGILLKVAFCGVSGAYWGLGNLPAMWQPFFVCDMIFMFLYVLVYRQLTAEAPGSAGGSVASS